MKQQLSLATLAEEAKRFCALESAKKNVALFGATDGKAVGTYIEHAFQDFLAERYDYARGSSASGIDFPDSSLNTDIKVTSIVQPQSSCPFRSARQKIYGLGYHLLLFVYEKQDDAASKTTRLNLLHCSFINAARTADYQTTKTLRQMLADSATGEEITAYLGDKNLPVDEIGLAALTEEILTHPPEQGYLTISNALQWRLQYGRVVGLAEEVEGIDNLVRRRL